MSNIKYTPEQLTFLKASYRIMSSKQLTLAFNDRYSVHKSVRCIRHCLINHGFKSGRTGRFPKGNNGPAGCPLGAEHMKDGCIEVKIAQPDVWMLKHHKIWIAKYGPI